MKRTYWLLYGMLCILLLIFSDAAVAAGKSAVSLCLTRVFPALFPFYVASTLFSSGGLYRRVQERCPRLMMPLCFLLGSISGYPVGARLCSLTGKSEWAVYCNLSNPAFLLGVVCIGMLNDKSFLPALMLAHYGAALLALIAESLLHRNDAPAGVSAAAPAPVSFTKAVGDGMNAMLSVGGCILFFSVCAAIIKLLFSLEGRLPGALITGLLEMTAGCEAVAALSLPMRLKTALIAAIISFGGLSVGMQTLSAAEDVCAPAYLAGKAFQSGLAFLIAYAVTPWFYHETGAVLAANMESLFENASVLAATLLSASAALTFVYLLALVLKTARRRAGAGR